MFVIARQSISITHFSRNIYFHRVLHFSQIVKSKIYVITIFSNIQNQNIYYKYNECSNAIYVFSQILRSKIFDFITGKKYNHYKKRSQFTFTLQNLGTI